MRMDTPRGPREDVELVTVEDALGLLRVSRFTLYRLMNSGELPSISFGKSRRIRLSALRKYLDRLEHQATPA